MSFNTIGESKSGDKVFTSIVNQIHVDGVNVKVLPNGTPPTVVYRIGDGTVHPDGFDNILDNEYLDFYVSSGAQGTQGEKGEDGLSAYTQAVAGGYVGTQTEFYALLTETTDNAILAEASAVAAALSELNASNSATASANSATNSETSATNSASSASSASTSATNASNSASSASASATSASNSATSASTSASAAATSATNSANSATASATSASNASTSESNASTSATNAQLEAWIAEAERMTADSYATEAEDVFVKLYTSDGDGTFTATPTTEYSSLHYAAKSLSYVGSAITTIPLLSGASTVVENNDLVVTITNYADYSTEAVWDNPITSSGTAVRVGDTITVSAGTVTADEPNNTVSITVNEPSHIDAVSANHVFTVTNVAVQNDTDYEINVSGSGFNATNFPTAESGIVQTVVGEEALRSVGDLGAGKFLYTGNGTSQEINIGLSSIDFTTVSNGTGYYHDRVAGDGIVKNDAGTPVESGTIAFKDIAGIDGVLRVHVKQRSGVVRNHYIQDGVRGINKYISSNLTDVEGLSTAGILNTTTNGFTVGDSVAYNENGTTYVSYIELYTHIKWGLTTQGKRYIEAYNPYSKMGMVLYQGSGTIGHLLPHSVGAILDYREIKNLDVVTDWLSPISNDGFCYLNTTAIKTASTSFVSTDTTQLLDATATSTNSSGNTFVMYYKAKSDIWTCGTYVGTGVAGNFIETVDGSGNVCRLHDITFKNTSAVGNWVILDNKRSPNDLNNPLTMNTSNAELVFDYGEVYDNGFSVETTNTDTNTLNNVYFYQADLIPHYYTEAEDGFYWDGESIYQSAQVAKADLDGNWNGTQAGYAISKLPNVITAGLLGNELVVSGGNYVGDFDVQADVDAWTAEDATLVLSGNQDLGITTIVSYGAATLDIVTIIGQSYSVSVELIAGGSVTASLYIKDPSVIASNTALSVGVNTLNFVATSTTTTIQLSNESATAGGYNNFDNISVKQVNVTANSTNILVNGEVLATDELYIGDGTNFAEIVATGAVYNDGADNSSTTDSVPTMTSNTAPSGVASASSNHVSFPAYFAFNDNETTGNAWLTAAGQLTGWVQYQRQSANIINKYIITAFFDAVDLPVMPKDFALKASNTGAFGGEEVTLDTQTNITTWAANTAKTFTFINSTEYLYYRLDCTLNNGDANYIGIAELELIVGDHTRIPHGQAWTPSFASSVANAGVDITFDGINYNTLVKGTATADASLVAPNTPLDEFETVLYTGNGTSQTVNMANITGGVDFTWIKERSGTDGIGDHYLTDSIRGVGNCVFTNQTAAEVNSAAYITALTASSFSLGNAGDMNGSGDNYVAWCASLPTKNPTNTAGTITSNTMANSFMSVVSYVGTGAIATVGHGLSKAPELLIFKNTDTVINWYVYNVFNGNAEAMKLNLTDASAADAGSFNSTTPTDSVFSVGSGTIVNGSTHNMIAYAFTSVDGLCKVGSYTGTGAVGNEVYCGFEPAWIMIKRTDLAADWILADNKRGTNGAILYPDLSNAELAGDYVSFDATGITILTTATGLNASGGTYIFLAIAKNSPEALIIKENFDASGIVANTGTNLDFKVTHKEVATKTTQIVIPLTEEA